MIITYIVKSDHVDVARVDTEVTLTLKPYSFPLPTYNDNTVMSWSMDRNAYRATHTAIEKTMSIEVRRVTTAELPYLIEFIESMKLRGNVEIDPEGYSGHPASYDYCVVTSASSTPGRDGYGLYRHTFTVAVYD